VGPCLDRLEETEGVVVVDNVGSAELENIRLLGVLGLRGFLVDLRVFHDIRLSILKKDKTNRLGGIALSHDLRSNIDILGGGKADEDGVSDLDQAVVNAVGVNVFDTAISHILADAGSKKSLVDTSISVRGDSDLG
jgi:hypothetical protein